MPMRLDHVNCYVIDDGDHWTLVDTGMNTSKVRGLWDGLLAGPLNGKPIGRLVLTHHHPDHVGLLGWFKEQGAEVWMTRYAYMAARMMTLDQPEQQPQEAVDFRLRAGQPPDEVADYAKEAPWRMPVWPIPLGFKVINDGDTLQMGGRDWKVHFGHGHAWDHATFWTDDVVLAGDQIIPGISSNVGVWAMEPEADTLSAWIESCHRLRTVASGTDPLILPGHKMPFRGVDFRLNQLIENHHGALRHIEKALKEGPRTAAQLFVPIFLRDIKGSQYGLALAEAVAHMNHLYLAGRVDRALVGDAHVYSLRS
ncbi:MAG: MBL fold metallo-hydrolase [Pseudomonadota bacterium]